MPEYFTNINFINKVSVNILRNNKNNRHFRCAILRKILLQSSEILTNFSLIFTPIFGNLNKSYKVVYSNFTKLELFIPPLYLPNYAKNIIY